MKRTFSFLLSSMMSVVALPALAQNYEMYDTTAVETTSPSGVSQAKTSTKKPYTDLRNNWSVGVGAVRGNRMGLGNPMYGVTIGHQFDFQSQIAFKAQLEAAFSTGRETGQFVSGSVGPMYYLNESRTAPYVQADLGYGGATTNNTQSVDGFTVGTAVGYQFWRKEGRSADLQLRYSWITAVTDAGQPSTFGAKFAVNF